MPDDSRFATIDIGTNSVKLTVAERSRDNQFVALFDTSLVTRLGENIQLGRLCEPAIRRTLDALADYKAICDREGVHRIAAVGTSALRDANNRDEFIARAADVELCIESIPGEEEARLSFLAVSRDPLWRAADGLLVIDIGGGSTEVIQGDRSGIHLRHSLQLGAVRLTEANIQGDPPSVLEIESASRSAATVLEGLEPAPPTYAVVGVGGTLTNLGAVKRQMEPLDLDELHGTELHAVDIEAQISQYASMPIEERKQIVGLNPARADIIMGGALIVREALARLGRTSIAVSCRGLRWGLMYDRFGGDSDTSG